MFKGFQSRSNIHTYTTIPNEFFDEVLATIENMAELKIILAVFRKTYGWVDKVENGEIRYKLEDSISYSQFRELTNLSDPSISEGLKRAISHGFIIKVRTGGLNAGSSRYKLRQLGEPTDTVEPEEQPPFTTMPPVEATKPLEATIPLDKGSSRKSLMEELVGSAKVAEEVKKKRVKRQNIDSKPEDQWNCNDILSYFAKKYKDALGISYANITAKDRMLAKYMLEKSDLTIGDIKKAIDYYIKNYQNIKGTPSGFPSWGIFYNWRTTIIPLALVGEDKVFNNKGNQVREYQEPTEEERKQFQVFNSWD
jgi:hypothetical protein